MGLFSNIFKGKSSKTVSGKNPGKGWTEANRFNKARGGFRGGWGAIAFGNIINAHSSPDDIVDTWELDKEGNKYCTAYEEAYKEQYDAASLIYEDEVGYRLGEIEQLTIERTLLLEEAEQLLMEAEQLRQEAQELLDEEYDDIEDFMEALEEAEELLAEADELQAEAEALQVQAEELQMMIDELYAQIEMLTIEEFIDYDEVERNAHEYALEFAEEWIDGFAWIPEEVLNWSYYEVSDHNG